MRTVFQIGSVLAIALGVGLIVGGNAYSASDGPRDFGQVVRSLERSSREVQEQRMTAGLLFGFGAGFLTLGTLGLAVPWGNALIYGRRTRSSGIENPPAS